MQEVVGSNPIGSISYILPTQAMICCPAHSLCNLSVKGSAATWTSLHGHLLQVGRIACLYPAYLLNFSLIVETCKEDIMFIVHVFVHVKADQVEAFRTATLENARSSMQEPGIAGFDVIQQQDDSTRFVLVEVYRTSDDPARHKETAHYQKWRDTVADMMAEPRTSVKYTNVFPDEQGWK